MGFLGWIGLLVLGLMVGALMVVYPGLWVLGVVAIGVLTVYAIGVLIKRGGADAYEEAHRNDPVDKTKAR